MDSQSEPSAATRIDPDSRGAVYGVVAMVAALAAVSFALGVPGLMTVGAWAGLPATLRWGVPVMLDGGIVIASLVAMVNRQRRESAVFAWTMVAVLTVASMASQAAHVLVTATDARAVTAVTGGALAAAFPASVWAATHLMIRTAVVPAPADAAPRITPQPKPKPQPKPAAAPRPAEKAPTSRPSSERDAEILRLRAEGQSGRQIATALGINPSTAQRAIRRLESSTHKESA